MADPWNPVTLDGPVQARYVFHIPLFGYLLAALAMRTVRLALIGLPSVLIALSLLWSLWRQAGEDVARQVEDKRARSMTRAAGRSGSSAKVVLVSPSAPP